MIGNNGAMMRGIQIWDLIALNGLRGDLVAKALRQELATIDVQTYG